MYRQVDTINNKKVTTNSYKLRLVEFNLNI